MIRFYPAQIRYTVLLSLVTILSACGGGAGGESGTTSTPSTEKPQTSSVQSTALSSIPRSSTPVSSANSISSSTRVDTTPPSAPTDMTATSLVHNRVGIIWNGASDNKGITAYKIYRDGVEIFSNNGIEQVYQDFNVAANKSYIYGVSAGDAAGNWSEVSNLKVDVPPKPTTSSSSASSKNSSSATSASSIISSAPISSISSTSSPSSSSSSTTTSASSSANTSSSAVTSSASSISVDVLAPNAPAQVNKVTATASQIDISWTAATDNIAVAAYRVYRSGALLTTLTNDQLSFSDNTVSIASNYWYGVSAGDAAGNWSLQTLINISTPSNITSGALLTWLPPTQRENGEVLLFSEIGGYEVRYRLSTENTYTYKSVDKNVTQILIENLMGDYIFEIAAYDTNGLYSSFISISPL